MVESLNSNKLSYEEKLQYSNFDNVQSDNTNIYETGIESNDTVDTVDTTGNDENIEENVKALQEELNSIEAENGAILDGWNNFKEFTGIGTSTSKCDEAITMYENGEITYEEALETIDNFSEKQDSSLNLFANIVTSAASIAAIAAVTVATGGTALPVIAAIGIGAATGAAAKASFKTADRATNEIEGDALDAKEIAKDALSGAVVGGSAAATMGTGGAAASCARTGAVTGAVAGGSNYAIDCAFNEDKDFNIKDFAVATGTGAVVGTVVGGTMGYVNGALKSSGLLNAGCNLHDMLASTENASIENVAANSANSASYKLLNDRISAVIH